MIPLGLPVTDLMGRMNGQTKKKLFRQFLHLRKTSYGGDDFRVREDSMGKVEMYADMIRKYVCHQKKKERHLKQLLQGV